MPGMLLDMHNYHMSYPQYIVVACQSKAQDVEKEKNGVR